MRQELLASQKSGRGILLDPRTKLALLITISVFVLSGGIGVNSRQFAPVLSAVPLILMLTEGAWKGSCIYFALYGGSYLLQILSLPYLSGLPSFFCCCSLWLFNEVCSGNYDGIHYSQNNHRQ